jgi:hypothetical protein
MKQPDCGHQCCGLRSNPYHTHSEPPERCVYCQLEAHGDGAPLDGLSKRAG